MVDTPKNVHLHCAQCDAQLGIFENEWVHLTLSYARPKERGINTGCRVGTRSQIVPHGPTQKEAAGCVMVELFCLKCSATVGQSCKTAPDPEQQHLVNQRIFKLSRIYLKDAHSDRREEPVFVDADNFEDQSRSTSVRSNLPPRQRSFSRNGHTPSFRQSYPPPLPQNPSYDQYPTQHTPMPPPRHYSHQAPSGPPFLPYHQPASLYNPSPHPLHTSQSLSDLVEPYRPFSAGDIPNLQQGLDEHDASISECLSRIASAETRLASDEKRLSDAERRSIDILDKLQKSDAPIAHLAKSLEQLKNDATSQNVRCVEHHNIIVKQKGVIVQQAQQLATLTEKLDLFQTTMNDLNVQIDEVRSRPVPQISQQAKSLDFLYNIEVMLKTARTAEAKEHELQALRDENEVIKARIGTIFTAMGTVSDEDTALLQDISAERDLLGARVLGKRKRPHDHNEISGRKMVRQISDTIAQADQPLPTPDSTEPRNQSSNVSQTSLTDIQARTEEDESIASQQGGNYPQMESSPIPSIDRGQQDDPAPLAEGAATNSMEETDESPAAQMVHIDCDEASAETIPQASTASNSAPSHVHDDNSQTTQQCDDQLAYFPHDSSGPRDVLDQINQPSHVSSWSSSRNLHPALYRPSLAYSRTVGVHSGHSPGNTMLPPPSYPLGPTHGNVTPRTQRWKHEDSNEGGTFSDALSRGHRLEDIIQRPSRRSSVLLVENIQPMTEQPGTETGQGVLNQQPQSAVLGSLETAQNAEAIEFSDEEHSGPVAHRLSGNVNKQVSSTTPTGEPHARLLDRAAAARTYRELTAEPLVRPVISNYDQSKEKRPAAAKGAFGKSQTSVLPSIAAAIQNLNNSAARHIAASSPRLSHSEVHKPSQGVDSAAQLRTSIGTEQTKNQSAEMEPNGSKAGDEDECPSASIENSQLKSSRGTIRASRGRPRKSQAVHEASTSIATNEPVNDDICAVCARRGTLLCCDGCPKAYHRRCLVPRIDPRQAIEGDWFCAGCDAQREQDKSSETITLNPVSDVPPPDGSLMMLRRRLAEEAMARDMAKVG